LEEAQEQTVLSSGEHLLIKTLKQRLLGLAVVEKSRARHKSRITWLRKGDANTKKIQVMANIRKQKNFIHALQTNENVVIRQEEKHGIAFNHFLNHIGTHVPRKSSLKLQELDCHPRDLQHPKVPLSEVEVKKGDHDHTK
jgi:hypothetical protein